MNPEVGDCSMHYFICKNLNFVSFTRLTVTDSNGETDSTEARVDVKKGKKLRISLLFLFEPFKPFASSVLTLLNL